MVVLQSLAFKAGFEGVPVIWVNHLVVSEVLTYTGRLRMLYIGSWGFIRHFLGPLHFLHLLLGGSRTRAGISNTRHMQMYIFILHCTIYVMNIWQQGGPFLPFLCQGFPIRDKCQSNDVHTACHQQGHVVHQPNSILSKHPLSSDIWI